MDPADTSSSSAPAAPAAAAASSSAVAALRRHYKKDSRFVNDLYTLTYDENESLDTVEPNTSVFHKPDAGDLQVECEPESGALASVCGIRELHIAYTHYAVKVARSANVIWWVIFTCSDMNWD